MPHAGTTLRQRRPSMQPDLAKLVKAKPGDEKSPLPRSSGKFAGFFDLFVLLLSLFFAVAFVFAINAMCKSRILDARNSNPVSSYPFNADSAINHIRKIGAKPRFVSSAALEESMQYIKTELEKVQSVAEANGMHLDVDLFRSDPDTFSTSIGNIYILNSYDNLTSVVARLRPANMPFETDEKTLLLNAHVDSAIGSPGANDNVVGAGVIMEIVSTIAALPAHVNKLNRPIVFLFNGAEEVILAGAHSFIKQHRFAKNIAAHINLESLGPGDSYNLFRLGPNSPWLAEAYANAVSIPTGSVTATDVFNSKVIPAETDFRIFDEIGNIPGYDFVLIDNGYVYHTIYDSIDKIDDTSVHHGGLTVFELVMELAGKRDAIGAHLSGSSRRGRLYEAIGRLTSQLGLTERVKHDNVVFFDILHRVTVVYDEGMALVINFCVLVVTVQIWVAKMSNMEKRDVVGAFRMLAVALLTIPAAFASATFASFVYAELLNLKLRWYGSTWKACLIFGPPTLHGTISAMLLLLPKRLSKNRFDQMLFAVTVFYSVALVLMTAKKVMSNYIPMVLLIVADICAIEGASVHPVVKHMEFLMAHGILGAKLMIDSFSSTLPIVGRIRSTAVPHDTFAALIVSGILLVHFIISSLPILCHYATCLRKLRMCTFLTSIGIAIFFLSESWRSGDLRHPSYSTDAPKRISAIHFYSPQMEPSSVLRLSPWDSIPLQLDRITSGRSENTKPLASEPSWGTLQSTSLESFRPFRVFLQDPTVYPTTVKPDLPVPTATVTSVEKLQKGWNISVTVEALDAHMFSVRLPVGPGSAVTAWSLDAKLNGDEGGAWIKHTGTSTFMFWLLVDGVNGDDSERPKITMALASGRMGFTKSPSELQVLRFAEWEAPAVAVCTGIEVEL